MKKINISEEIIKMIFEKNDLGEVEAVKELQGGFANPAFLVNERYVFRVNDDLKSDRRDCFLRESTLYSLFEELKIPSPKPVAIDITKEVVPFYYIINTYVEGDILSSIYRSLDDEVKTKIANDLGKLLKKVHSIAENQLAQQGELFSWKMPWKEKSLASFDETYSQFNQHDNSLSTEDRNTVDKVYDDYKEGISNADISFGLIHNDFHANHVVIDGGSITGIIDFEWASFGDPLWDFQKLSVHLGEGPKGFFSNFLRGYGIESFSDKELIRYRMYCIEQAIWQIDRTRFSDHGFPQEGIKQGYEMIKNLNNLSI